jgi:RHS repeat-associated protein
VYYAEISLPYEWEEGASDVYDGPITITWYNAGGDVIGRSTRAPGDPFSYPTGDQDGYELVVTEFEPYGAELSRSATVHNLAGQVLATHQWSNVGDSPADIVTTQSYDALGRLRTSTTPNGTITLNEYDVLDRIIRVSIGTDDDPTTGDMVVVSENFYDSAGTTTPGVGNGYLTRVRRHASGSDQRDVIHTYDWRGRRISTQNPLAPHSISVYDNMDRPIRQAVVESIPGTPFSFTAADANRVSVTESSYSQRGQAYRTAQVINPTDGSGDWEYLESHTWFDDAGRAIAQLSPGGGKTKTTLDGLGRPVITYMTDGNDPAPGTSGNYAAVHANHAAVVSDDVVLTETQQHYINNEPLVDLTTTRQRTHDALDGTKIPLTGSLAGYGDATKVITTYTGQFYDDAGRATHAANYGTAQSTFQSGGTAPTITQGSPPTPSATILVTQSSYNERGMVDTTVMPDATVHKVYVDDLNRQIAVVVNYMDVDADDISWSSGEGRWQVDDGLDPAHPDKDRVTSFVYDASGNMIKRVAHLPDTTAGAEGSAQVTTYIYGVTTSATSPQLDSLLVSEDMLAQVIYPEGDTSTTVQDRSAYFAYNRLGQVIEQKDQLGTVHAYEYDALGRRTKDEVTTFGTNVDQGIESIESAFTTDGRLATVTSRDGSQGIVNQVEYTYGVVGDVDLGHLTSFKQEHDGAVDGNSHTLSFAYDTQAFATTGITNYSRLDTVTYDNGTIIRHVYDPDGTGNDELDTRISRLRQLVVNPASDNITAAAYHYVGAGMPAVVDYDYIDTQLDYTANLDGTRGYGANGTTSGVYPNIDRFGRVLSQRWVTGDYYDDDGATTDDPTRPAIVSLDYTYDTASNRTSRINTAHSLGGTATVAGGWKVIDEEFQYDGLDRLTRSWRGTRVSSTPWDFTEETANEFTQEPSTEEWVLDMLGNWAEYDTNADESVFPMVFNAQQDRTHTTANELTEQDFATGTDLALTYDKAGNIFSQQTATSSYRMFIHDAWGRLVRVYIDADGQGSIPYDGLTAEYEYNGLNWRVEKRSKVDFQIAGVTPDQQRVMYYNPAWQMIEEDVWDGWTDAQTSADIDRYVQYLWGGRGINDIILRRENHDFTNDSPTVTYDRDRFYLTDPQFSPVAIVEPDATLDVKIIERLSYTPYGQVQNMPRADVTGDGAVTTADQFFVQQKWGGFGPGDVDLDGSIGTPDFFAVLQGYTAALPFGVLSDASVTAGEAGEDNVIGYCGYVFNNEFSTYLSRNRQYDPALGRWLRRDPAGYVDGASLYEYGRSQPNTLTDVMGLDSRNTSYKVVLVAKFIPGTSQTLPGESYTLEGMTDAFDQLGQVTYVQTPRPGVPSEVNMWTFENFAAYYASQGSAVGRDEDEYIVWASSYIEDGDYGTVVDHMIYMYGGGEVPQLWEEDTGSYPISPNSYYVLGSTYQMRNHGAAYAVHTGTVFCTCEGNPRFTSKRSGERKDEAFGRRRSMRNTRLTAAVGIKYEYPEDGRIKVDMSSRGAAYRNGNFVSVAFSYGGIGVGISFSLPSHTYTDTDTMRTGHYEFECRRK